MYSNSPAPALLIFGINVFVYCVYILFLTKKKLFIYSFIYCTVILYLFDMYVLMIVILGSLNHVLW